jgi:hypothetical protein
VLVHDCKARGIPFSLSVENQLEDIAVTENDRSYDLTYNSIVALEPEETLVVIVFREGRS